MSLRKTTLSPAVTPTKSQPFVQAVSKSDPIPTVFIASPTVEYLSPALSKNVPAESTQAVVTLTAAEETSSACDLAAAGIPIDVTVPDGTRFQPGETFAKTWRLVNAGTCPWTQKYAVVWFSGQSLGIAPPQPMPGIVQPGESVDITVDMMAPYRPGTYQGNWKLRNADGQLFGLGPNGDSPFWVQIEVVENNTPESETLPSETPTLAIYAGGAANMVVLDGLDLDTGDLNQPSEDDFVYQINNQEQPQFMPENGAQMAFFGNTEPVENQCQVAVLGTGSLALPGIDEGVYLCYRTSLGLPGFLRVTKPSKEDNQVSLDFVTWTIP
jgi:hypothetical protein